MSGLEEKIAKLILRERLIKEGDLVVVAVSGGPDSLALLHILGRLARQNSFLLYVAHLNHGLRGKAAEEDLRFVRREAKRLALPFSAGKVNVEAFQKRHGLSPEDAARRLRYRFLGQLAKRIDASCVAVGHSLDDQVETVLLNLLRGTGPDGLAGMKLRREMGSGQDLFLIRPLLETGREEIIDYCREKGLSPRLDRTNLERRFLRNKVRLDLLPSLAREYNPNIRQSLFRLSQLVALDNKLLNHLAARRLAALTLEEKPLYLKLAGEKLARESEALQGRILRLAIGRLWGMVPREIGFDHIQSILELTRGSASYKTLTLPRGLKVLKSYHNLVFSWQGLEQETFVPFYLKVPGEAQLFRGSMVLKAEIVVLEKLPWPPDRKKEAYLDFGKVAGLICEQEQLAAQEDGLSLLVRPRLPGDRFHPLGAPGRKKLKKYFIDEKVPQDKRDCIPLVLAGERIIWVAGFQIAHDCRVTEKSRKVLLLRFTPRRSSGIVGRENQGFAY